MKLKAPGRLIPLLATLALALVALPAGAAKVRIKLATQAPENSPWYQHLKSMGEEWEQITGGDVSLAIYPGGVSGDESDIIRKIRIRQLHAGALTVAGLTDLDDVFSVFEIPLFFDSWEELNFVLEELTPHFRQKLDDAGFVWLTWGHVGWVHFFTKQPVERLDDLRELKIFTWAGNDNMVQWWKRNGFNPVALALPDALQGLKTGMIETMISPPLAAAQLQWFKEAPYMIDIGLAPLVGAVVVHKSVWNRIDAKYHEPMLEVSMGVGEKLKKQVPFLDESSVGMMKNQGLTVLEIKDSEHAGEWLAEATKFADEMRGGMVPPDIFDRVKRLRDEFRSRNGASGSGS